MVAPQISLKMGDRTKVKDEFSSEFHARISFYKLTLLIDLGKKLRKG